MGSEPAAADAAASNSPAEPATRNEGMAASQAGSPAPAFAAAASQAEIVRSGSALDIEFNLAVDVIYHRSRQAWLMSCHRVMLLGAIAFGSFAASDLLNPKWCALLGMLAATLDLVADYTTRAGAHGDAARELSAVAAEVHRRNFDEESCRRATEEWFRIGAAEPAVFHAARDRAWNQAVLALGRDKSGLLKQPLSRRALRQVLRFEGS